MAGPRKQGSGRTQAHSHPQVGSRRRRDLGWERPRPGNHALGIPPPLQRLHQQFARLSDGPGETRNVAECATP